MSDERLVQVSFSAASERLSELASGGLLDGLSERMYQGGVAYLLRVGPAGTVLGASRLVRVRFTVPARHDQTVTVALRWETVGVTGGLFPALDADIRIAPDGDHSTRIILAGSYRPPLGVLGARLDQFALHTVASATIRVLLARIAAALEDATAEAADAADAAEPMLPWAPEAASG